MAQLSGTVGRPHAGIDIRILSEEGIELPSGEPGTIYIRPMNGDRFEYRDDPRGTSAAYRGNYFTAGDVGYLNQAGYLFICDRAVDMVLRGGINVYPAEIEDVLFLHPAVADCVVFGIPDSLFGESLVALVQLAASHPAGKEVRSAILHHMSSRLAPAKVPTRIDFVECLPRDALGKVGRRRLSNAFLSKL